jgi:hypothetical protein
MSNAGQTEKADPLFVANLALIDRCVAEIRKRATQFKPTVKGERTKFEGLPLA